MAYLPFYLFVLLRLSVYHRRPSILVRVLCSTQSADSNANLFLEYPEAHPDDVLPAVCSLNPVKLAHTINHCMTKSGN